MKVKLNIQFDDSRYVGDDSEPTRMRVGNIKSLKKAINGLGLREAKEFVESCTRDLDKDYSEWSKPRSVIFTAEQWGTLTLLRVTDQCAFHFSEVTILEDDDVVDFSRE